MTEPPKMERVRESIGGEAAYGRVKIKVRTAYIDESVRGWQQSTYLLRDMHCHRACV